jgi:hypothetical protein
MNESAQNARNLLKGYIVKPAGWRRALFSILPVFYVITLVALMQAFFEAIFSGSYAASTVRTTQGYSGGVDCHRCVRLENSTSSSGVSAFAFADKLDFSALTSFSSSCQQMSQRRPANVSFTAAFRDLSQYNWMNDSNLLSYKEPSVNFTFFVTSTNIKNEGQAFGGYLHSRGNLLATVPGNFQPRLAGTITSYPWKEFAVQKVLTYWISYIALFLFIWSR